MKHILKWLGIILGGLVAVIVLALLAVYAVSGSRINRTHTVAVGPIPIANDAEMIAWGQHIALSRGCMDCHGEDLAGKLILDEPPVATVYGPNLTSHRKVKH